MRDEASRVIEIDGSPRQRAVLACALMTTITMTTKTSRRAAEVM
jgi:hypothetical protein